MNDAVIEIQIDELVVTGLSGIDRARLGAALTAELERLIAETGLPPALLTREPHLTLDGGAVRLRPGMRAEQIGQEIARALYRSWSR